MRFHEQQGRDSFSADHAALNSSDYSTLEQHPRVTVHSEGRFLQSLSTVQEILRSMPVVFLKTEPLQLVIERGILHVYGLHEPVSTYEITTNNSALKVKRDLGGTMIRFELDGGEGTVVIHDRDLPTVSYERETFVPRTTSPWRAPARKSIHDHSSESSGGSFGER